MLKAAIFATGIILLFSMASAEVPPYINYQGRLTDVGGSPMDTTIAMDFYILNDSAGTDTIWTETHPSVVVDDGLFHVRLGWYTYLPDTVFNNETRWLVIEVGGEEISPHTRLISVAYAFHAKNADTAGVALSGPAGNSGWSDDGGTVRLTTSTDNVGIGTGSPSEKLDVDGNVHASGTIKSGSSITINGTTDEITASGGVIGFDDEDLETDGDIRIGNTASITDGIKLGIRENLGTVSPFMKFYVESSMPSDLLNSAFEIYSPAYDYTPIKILGAGAIIQETSNKFGRAGTIANQIDPDPSGVTYFNAGSVGIGTDAPYADFEVNGWTRIMASDIVQPHYSLEVIGHNHNAIVGAFSNSDVNNVAGFRVGRFDDDLTTQLWALEMDGQATNSTDFSLIDYTLPGRYVWSADAGTGNIGIGVNNASEKLQVAGTVHSTTGGFRFPDGSVQTTAAEAGHPANVSTTGEGFSDINIEESYTILLTNTLEATTSGYAMVIGTGDFTLTASSGSASIIVGVSDNPASLPPEGNPMWVLPPSEAGTNWQQIITVHNVFPVSPGSHNFYFLARKANSATTASAIVRNLSVMFIPTGG